MYLSSTRVWACAADPQLCGVDSGRGIKVGATAGGIVGGTVPMVEWVQVEHVALRGKIWIGAAIPPIVEKLVIPRGFRTKSVHFCQRVFPSKSRLSVMEIPWNGEAAIQDSLIHTRIANMCHTTSIRLAGQIWGIVHCSYFKTHSNIKTSSNHTHVIYSTSLPVLPFFFHFILLISFV